MKQRLFLLLMTILFIACKAKEIYVPVKEVRMEYRDRLQRDSIYILDSVITSKQGDTIYLQKYRNVYMFRYLRDTVAGVDSIRVPYPVEKIVEVNKLKWWQQACIWFTSIATVLAVIYLGFKNRSIILAFFRKLVFKI